MTSRSRGNLLPELVWDTRMFAAVLTLLALVYALLQGMLKFGYNPERISIVKRLDIIGMVCNSTLLSAAALVKLVLFVIERGSQ
jgi:hypothetical protein